MIETRNLAPERQERLRDMVRESGVARVDDLVRRLKVSPATVRRDLEILESRGRIRRVHGGAMSVESRLEEPLFDEKTSIAARQKRSIAERAAGHVRSGETIYLDGGSTVLELARLLRPRTDITVVTNSLRAAIELSGSGPCVVLVGGELRRRSQTMVGALTRHLLEQMHLDKAFMGTIGLTATEGPTTTDPDEAYTKDLVMRRAHHVILLADSAKIGTISTIKAGSLEDIDCLIVDKAIAPQSTRAFRKKGLKVEIV